MLIQSQGWELFLPLMDNCLYYVLEILGVMNKNGMGHGLMLVLFLYSFKCTIFWEFKRMESIIQWTEEGYGIVFCAWWRVLVCALKIFFHINIRMSFDDFLKNFEKLEICNLGPDVMEEVYGLYFNKNFITLWFLKWLVSNLRHRILGRRTLTMAHGVRVKQPEDVETIWVRMYINFLG